MEMALAVPLTMLQIEAANRLHRQLTQWQATGNALLTLKDSFPEFDIESSLLKVAAVNQLYGTKVFAVVRMAQHIVEVMCQANTMYDVGLVDEIAALSDMKHTSFASKFAHFFIDVERFPIYDYYAVKMVAYHLGSKVLIKDTEHPYKAFVTNFNQLKRAAGLECTTRELDHYLWLAGLYQVWQENREQQTSKDKLKKPKRYVNTEVAQLFKVRSIEAATLLPELYYSVSGVLS